MTTLLQENAEINRQRIQVLEASKQRLLWAQIIVGILVVSILAALGYFWHLHAKNLVNRGVEAISNTLSNFQDSFLQFVDTTQMASNSERLKFCVESKHKQRSNKSSAGCQATPDLELTLDAPDRRRQALSAQRATNISPRLLCRRTSTIQVRPGFPRHARGSASGACRRYRYCNCSNTEKAEETPALRRTNPMNFSP